MPSLLKPSERAAYDRRFALVRAMPRPIAPEERFRVGIDQVGVEGYLKFEGQTFHVQRVNGYERQGASWPELELYCLEDGSTRYLEWEQEDEISVYVSRETLDFPRVGIRDAAHLRKMSQAEQGSLAYGGERFRYHEDSQITFRRDRTGEPTPFRQYLFASQKKRAYLCVEEWGNEREGYEHKVILSDYVDPRSIEVLVAGDGDA